LKNKPVHEKKLAQESMSDVYKFLERIPGVLEGILIFLRQNIILAKKTITCMCAFVLNYQIFTSLFSV